MNAKPLEVQAFGHLLNPELVDLADLHPVPTVQWTRLSSNLRETPVRLSGFLVHLPGAEPQFVQSEARAQALCDYVRRHLRAATYLAELDGHLYDWRVPGGKLLRQHYSCDCPEIRTGRDLCATLRFIPSQPCRESMYFRLSNGGCMCPDCVRRELPLVINSIRYGIDDPWQVVGFTTLWQPDPLNELTCDHCDRTIQPVYEED